MPEAEGKAAEGGGGGREVRGQSLRPRAPEGVAAEAAAGPGSATLRLASSFGDRRGPTAGDRQDVVTLSGLHGVMLLPDFVAARAS